MAFFDTMETDREMRRRAELSNLHDAIGYLKAINAGLVTALEAVEWVYDSEIDGLFCPTCALPKPTHTRGCQLAAALAKAKKR